MQVKLTPPEIAFSVEYCRHNHKATIKQYKQLTSTSTPWYLKHCKWSKITTTTSKSSASNWHKFLIPRTACDNGSHWLNKNCRWLFASVTTGGNLSPSDWTIFPIFSLSLDITTFQTYAFRTKPHGTEIRAERYKEGLSNMVCLTEQCILAAQRLSRQLSPVIKQQILGCFDGDAFNLWQSLLFCVSCKMSRTKNTV